MTLKQYLDQLAWPLAELSRRSGLAYRTINRVMDGEPVYRHTVAAVAKALSEALGKTVTVEDIKGVNIIE